MKYGVLGLGSIGTRHAQNLVNGGQSVIAFDPCEKRCQHFNKCGLTIVSSRASVIEQCEAVIIASPNENHFGDLKACLAASRHVFVEKPFTHLVQGVAALLEDAAKEKLIVFAGFNLRYHPAVIGSRKMILNGDLGDLHWARVLASFYLPNWRPLDDYRLGYTANPKTGGVIFDVIHEIDLANHLLGKPEVIAAVARNSGKLELTSDDVADIILRHPEELITSVHLDFITQLDQRVTEISGAKGFLTIDLKGRRLELKNFDGKITFDQTYKTTWDDDYKDEITAFISLVEGKSIPYCDGFEALEIIKVAVKARQMSGLPS